MPAGAAGAADVVVTNPDGQSATLAGGFIYLGIIEPTLIPTLAADVSVDYSAIGEAGQIDGSAGEVAFMVQFTDNVYEQQSLMPLDVPNAYLPGKEDGTWDYHGYTYRTLDKDGFDLFKTRFYVLQGWDPKTGYPTRKALDSLDLGYVADELEEKGLLGDA